jgi:O-antigen ligase
MAPQNGGQAIGLPILLMLQATIASAMLYHLEGEGQSGRPTPFQLGMLALSILSISVFFRHHAAGASAKLDRAVWLLSSVIGVSWLVNVFGGMMVTQALSDISEGDSYIKLTILSFFAVISFAVAYFTGKHAAANAGTVRKVVWTIVLCASINGLAVIGAWFTQTGGIMGRYNFELPIFKSYGLSATASYTGLLLILPLWVSGSRSTVVRLFLTVLAAICIFSCIVILSRQAIATLVAAVSLYFYITMRATESKYTRVLLVAAVLLLVVILIAKMFGWEQLAGLYERLNDESDYSVTGREGAIMSSLEIYKSNPVFGVGYGFWFAHNSGVFAVVKDATVIVASPHNGAALIISELGTLGTLVFAYWNYILVRTCYRATQQKVNPFLHDVGVVIFVLVAIYSFGQLLSNSSFLPPPAETSSVQMAFILWLLIGISAGIPVGIAGPKRTR